MSTTAVRDSVEVNPEPSAWSFGLDLDGYDRRMSLSGLELRALTELGPARLRRARARGGAAGRPLWDDLARLVGPLDDARALLHHSQDARQRRASAHAAGLVLQHCAESDRTYWAWAGADWVRLCGPSAEEFIAARRLPTETTVRPFLLLGEP